MKILGYIGKKTPPTAEKGLYSFYRSQQALLVYTTRMRIQKLSILYLLNGYSILDLLKIF